MSKYSDILTITPIAFSGTDCGWWCLICKKHLGHAGRDHPNWVEIRCNAYLHAEQHKRKMREQL